MKTRLGFVSNSSSSSFCLYGVNFGDEIVLTKEDYEFMNKHGLHDERGQYDSIYVGREWKTIRDHETGGQFKESVAISIRKRWPGNTCTTHEEGWYNG